MAKGTTSPSVEPGATRDPSAGSARHSRGTRRAAREKRTGRGPAWDFRAIEARWRARWEATKLYAVDLRRAPRPYYNLMMFPYPSAAGLHAGNMYSYVGSDVHGRWMAMRGYDVFEPMGFDAFGIHSENYAIKHGLHPRGVTERNIAHFREQLDRIGNRLDWSHELRTYEPNYYRWSQWIFVKLFKAGLAERKLAPVNWCPKDRTVLADEQVIAGRCERCQSVVERRELAQWFLKITRYADKLLENLERLDWSERVKALQRQWIGRSTGLEFTLAVEAHQEERITVYTTRPDTIFGMTFVVLAPEHPLVEHITGSAHRKSVEAYQERVRRMSPLERMAGEQAPTGAFTGAYAIHPLTGERVPVWIADYVLMDYGSGAIMAVPAHDERDLRFAQAMGLPVRYVVRPAAARESPGRAAGAFTEAGVLEASGAYSGMPSAEAAEAIMAWCEAQGIGRRSVKYHLRDWLISRQRYWGPPIPIIYCPEHGAVPVPEEQLPVLLPDIAEYQPDGSGVAPLARVPEFVNTVCPTCGQPARRETDVSDNFLDSAWYFLRYPSTGDDTRPWDPELTRKWLPVRMYIGGAEHSVLHLMYARFITMALHDLGYLDFEEPFVRFRANGRITFNGAKMSKSLGNVVDPDTYLDRYGADVFRTYLLFMGPYESGGDFTDRGIGGVVRFLERVWQLVPQAPSEATDGEPAGEAAERLHATIRQVTADIGAVKYNTAIAALMKYANALEGAARVTRAEWRTLVLLLAPFAPFLAEDLWERLGGTGSVHTQPWPEASDAALRGRTVTIVVQVNGRLRDRITACVDSPAEEIERQARASANVQRFIAGHTVRQVVYAPGRVINLVID
jgi:leucyl-tRNA synthetase